MYNKKYKKEDNDYITFKLSNHVLLLSGVDINISKTMNYQDSWLFNETNTLYD